MKSRIDFSRVAPFYQLLEVLAFGRRLQGRRRAFLSEVAGATRVLILGDGDGRFSAEYISLNRQAHVTLVDISAGMQRLAQARLSRHDVSSGRIVRIAADARTFAFEGPYDLVVTHFFLDCFGASELEILVPKLARSMTAEGRWLISEFQIPRPGIRRLLAKALIWLMYKFFQLFAGLRTNRLPPYPAILEANGLRLVKRQSAAGGLLVSELWHKGP